MRIRSGFLAVALAAAVGATASSGVAAQATPAPVPGAEQPASSYSDDELKTFAVAALEVLRINDLYLPKLKLAKTPEEQQEVEKAATQDMMKAVEKEGLTVSKYKEIMAQADANPAIADRIIKHMKDAQAAPGAGR